MELDGSIDLVSISDYLPLPEGGIQYSSDFIETHSVIVLKDEREAATVGICHPDNPGLKDILNHFHDKRIIYKKIEQDELSGFLGRLHSGFDSGNGLSAEKGSVKLLLDRIANDAPVINFVNSTIIEGIRKRASDIHIEAFENSVKIRYRIDGILETEGNISPSMFPAVSSRIKIMSNLNIMERRLPQDGRSSVQLGDDTQDIRVSIVPTSRGESIVLRLLSRKSSLIDLDNLGIRYESLSDIRKMLKIPYGLILSTGPTGSGKTTTLNSMIREMDSEHKKIITIEDPIEYAIDGVNQIQTNEIIGLNFSNILKRILRQDPNVIMVGEIRDRETADLCIRAALTGHLVLSTLHTNDAVSVVERLRDMGIEPFMIGAVLKASMAQRLVRKLCFRCRKRRKISSAERGFFGESEEVPEYIYDAAGCESCNGTGYRGRVPLFEYFFRDEDIEGLIASGRGHSEIRKYLGRNGMVTMFRDGLLKIGNGLTTLSELEMVMTLQ